MQRTFKNEFYGDEMRWFLGVVEDIHDPLKLGRVRVRVRGIHSYLQEDIDTADLPWAQVGTPTTEGGISGIGRATGIQPGAEVFGFFLDGKSSQLPMVLGTLPKIEYASSNQSANFSDNNISRSGKFQTTSPGTGSTGARNGIEPLNSTAYGEIGNTNAEKAFNFFIASGFTPEQASGIVGNLMVESGPTLPTTIKSGGSERSFGIAQWNSAAAAGNRFGHLKEFANDIGKGWDELETQLRFIVYELESFSHLGLAQIRRSQSIEEAAIAFESHYERPSEPHRSRRIAYANDVYKRFNT